MAAFGQSTISLIMMVVFIRNEITMTVITLSLLYFHNYQQNDFLIIAYIKKIQEEELNKKIILMNFIEEYMFFEW